MKLALGPYMFRTVPLLELRGLNSRNVSFLYCAPHLQHERPPRVYGDGGVVQVGHQTPLRPRGRRGVLEVYARGSNNTDPEIGTVGDVDTAPLSARSTSTPSLSSVHR